MTKVLSFRVSDEEALWCDEYVKSRDTSRQDFLVQGFRSYREDCVSGVPEIPREAPKPPPARRSEPSPAFADADGTRQQRLNAQMLAARRSVRK